MFISLKNKTSAGPDELTPKIHKKVGNFLVKLLVYVLNSSFISGIFLSELIHKNLYVTNIWSVTSELGLEGGAIAQRGTPKSCSKVRIVASAHFTLPGLGDVVREDAIAHFFLMKFANKIFWVLVHI